MVIGNGVAEKFDWEGNKMEKSCNVSLVTFFSAVITVNVTEMNDFITDI